MKRLWMMIALVLLLPLSARGSNVTATVWYPSSYMKNAIKDAIQPMLTVKGYTFTTGIFLQDGANDWTVRANIAITMPGLLTKVYMMVEFDIVMSCNASGIWPRIQALDAYFIGVSGLNPSDAEKKKLEDSLDASMLERADELSDGLFGQLRFLDNTPGGLHTVCPTFSVTSNGSVKAVMDFVDGCITGTVRDPGCPANAITGHGLKQVCTNGKWYTTRKDTCEVPDAPEPPGGNPH